MMEALVKRLDDSDERLIRCEMEMRAEHDARIAQLEEKYEEHMRRCELYVAQNTRCRESYVAEVEEKCMEVAQRCRFSVSDKGEEYRQKLARHKKYFAHLENARERNTLRAESTQLPDNASEDQNHQVARIVARYEKPAVRQKTESRDARFPHVEDECVDTTQDCDQELNGENFARYEAHIIPIAQNVDAAPQLPAAGFDEEVPSLYVVRFVPSEGNVETSTRLSEPETRERHRENLARYEERNTQVEQHCAKTTRVLAWERDEQRQEDLADHRDCISQLEMKMEEAAQLSALEVDEQRKMDATRYEGRITHLEQQLVEATQLFSSELDEKQEQEAARREALLAQLDVCMARCEASVARVEETSVEVTQKCIAQFDARMSQLEIDLRSDVQGKLALDDKHDKSITENEARLSQLQENIKCSIAQLERKCVGAIQRSAEELVDQRKGDLARSEARIAQLEKKHEEAMHHSISELCEREKQDIARYKALTVWLEENRKVDSQRCTANVKQLEEKCAETLQGNKAQFESRIAELGKKFQDDMASCKSQTHDEHEEGMAQIAARIAQLDQKCELNIAQLEEKCVDITQRSASELSKQHGEGVAQCDARIADALNRLEVKCKDIARRCALEQEDARQVVMARLNTYIAELKEGRSSDMRRCESMQRNRSENGTARGGLSCDAAWEVGDIRCRTARVTT